MDVGPSIKQHLYSVNSLVRTGMATRQHQCSATCGLNFYLYICILASRKAVKINNFLIYIYNFFLIYFLITYYRQTLLALFNIVWQCYQFMLYAKSQKKTCLTLTKYSRPVSSLGGLPQV